MVDDAVKSGDLALLEIAIAKCEAVGTKGANVDAARKMKGKLIAESNIRYVSVCPQLLFACLN